MPFEVYDRSRAPVAHDPYLTIHRRGTFALNAIAYEMLGSPEAIELLFDRESRQIGLRPVDPGANHAYVVRPNGTSSRSYLVSGIAFASRYEISTDPARRYPARLDDGTLIVDLNGPSAVVVSNRRQATPQPEPPT